MSFKARCYSFYKSIDQYGVSPRMGINGEEKRRTICGSSLTIFVILTTICMIYISSRDYIFKQNPDISSSTLIKKQHESKRLGHSHDFDFAFQMMDQVGNEIVDEKYVRPSALYFIDNPRQIVMFSVKLCDASNTIHEDLIGKAWCLTNEIQNNNITVSNFSQVFQVQVDLCINDPSKNITGCEAEQVVKDKLRISYFRIYYNGLSINLNKYNNPVDYVLSDSHIYTGIDLSRVMRVELETITVESDDGFFYPLITEKSYTGVSKIYNEIQPGSQGGLAQLLINSGRTEVQYSRSYKKYDLISAEVTGVMGVIGIFLKFFVLPYFEKSYYADLVEKIYQVSLNKSKMKKSKVDFVELIKDQKIRQKNQIEKEDQIQENSIFEKSGCQFIDEKDLNSEYQHQHKRPSQIEQQSCDIEADIYDQSIQNLPHMKSQNGGTSKREDRYADTRNEETGRIHNKFCKKRSKSKRKIIDVGIAKVKKELDIFTILQKLKEIDRIKYCVLNHDQLILFDNLPNLKLSYESSSHRDDDPLKMMYSRLLSNFSDNAKQEYITNTYEKLKNKQNKSEMDKNILASYERSLRLAE